MVKKVSSPTPPDDNNSGFNSKAAIEAYAKSGNQHRDYSNLVPGISGRPGLTFDDYYSFRPDEQISTYFSGVIS